MKAHVLLLALAAVLATSPQIALAQTDEGPQGPQIRALGGLSLFYAQPYQEFADYVERGFGVSFYGAIPVDQREILSVRLDGGITNYGNERARFPLSPTLGNLIQVDVTTSNNIFFMGVGPQLTAPGEGARPYVHAAVGGSYFATQSSVEGSDHAAPFAQTTNFDDFVFNVSSGLGVLIPVVRGQHPIMIDIGAAYHHNGPTKYLRKGSLELLADDSVTITPVESRTSYFTFRVGIATRTGG